MIRSLDAHARRLGGRKLLVARVDQLLTQHGPRLSLRSAARSLGLSARTLTRRLRAEGASYFALVDETRKAQAESLLSDPEITLAETAHALGYGDTASFGRAFRRWFAVPPGQYRKHYDRVVGR
jgi:AraC-like DNA-binding protein